MDKRHGNLAPVQNAPVYPGTTLAGEGTSLASRGVVRDSKEAKRLFQPALNDIAELIGVEAALRLSHACGGRDVFVPHACNASRSTLAQIVGSDVVERLSERYGSSKLRVPLGVEGSTAFRRRVGISMLEDGASINTVSGVLRIARSTAQAWAQQADQTKRRTAIEERDRLAAIEAADRQIEAADRQRAKPPRLAGPGAVRFRDQHPETIAFLADLFRQGYSANEAHSKALAKFGPAAVLPVAMIYHLAEWKNRPGRKVRK